MPINTGQAYLALVTDNPNNYEVDTISTDGVNIVKFNSFTRQHYWASKVSAIGLISARDIVLDPPVASESDLQLALQALTAVRGGEFKLITQADLSVAAVVAIIPAFAGTYRDIEVYNNEGELINPDTIVVTALGIAIGLETYTPIAGTYKILYRIEQI